MCLGAARRRRWVFVAMLALAVGGVLGAGAWLWASRGGLSPIATSGETPYAHAWRRALADADDPSAWLRAGEAAMEVDALAVAEEAFERAAALAPLDPTAHARLGALAFAREDDRAARLHLERVRALGGDESPTSVLLAQLDARAAGQREEREAREARLAAAAEAAEHAEAEAARLRAEAEAETTAAQLARVAAEALRDDTLRRAEAARAEAEAAVAEADSEAAEARRRLAAAESAEALAREAHAAAEAADSDRRREVAEAEAAQAAAEVADADARRRERRRGTPDREACRVSLLARPSGTLLIRAAVNGRSASFVLDTGASYTTISRRAAIRLGVVTDGRQPIRVSTANGMTLMQLGRISEIGIGTHAVRLVTVAICDRCMHHADADGLFGRDMQEAFRLDVDLEGRRAWLPGCD